MAGPHSASLNEMGHLRVENHGLPDRGEKMTGHGGTGLGEAKLHGKQGEDLHTNQDVCPGHRRGEAVNTNLGPGPHGRENSIRGKKMISCVRAESACSVDPPGRRQQMLRKQSWASPGWGPMGVNFLQICRI